MGKYICENGPDKDFSKYDLFAVSQHYGSTGGGHYTAICKIMMVNGIIMMIQVYQALHLVMSFLQQHMFYFIEEKIGNFSFLKIFK